MPIVKQPTNKDLTVLTAIKQHLAVKHLAPTRAELCRLTGFSTGTVWGSLGRLKRFGLATWTKGSYRSIRTLA